MAWFRVRLTEEERRVVDEDDPIIPTSEFAERCSCFGSCTPGSRVSMRPRLSESVGHRPAIVAAFRQGGLDGLRQWNLSRRVSNGRLWRVDRASFESDQPRPSPRHPNAFSTGRLGRGPSHVRSSSRIGPEVLAGPCDPRAAKKN